MDYIREYVVESVRDGDYDQAFLFIQEYERLFVLLGGVHLSVGAFSSIINQRRLERFKYLLNYSNWHINEISQKCGFNSVSYAIRLFRQENGITPHQYRKRLKENGGLKYNASGPRIYPSL